MPEDLRIDIERFPWIQRLVLDHLETPVVMAHRDAVLDTGVHMFTLMVDTGDGQPGSIEDRRCDWCRMPSEDGLHLTSLPFQYVPVKQPQPDLVLVIGVCSRCRDKMASVMLS